MPRLANITFACAEPVRLAEFWGEALGYVEPELPPAALADIQRSIDAGELDPTAWAMRVPPDGTGPRLLFQRRPKGDPTDIPIHLDISVDDVEAEVERLVALGASVVERKSHRVASFEEHWVVMKDPEGNGFCVQ